MAVYEELDKYSGAIIFKKDEESRNLESLITTVDSLQKQLNKLEKRLKALESGK